MGRDSVVGLATCYELDGTGIESRWGRDFEHPSRPAYPASCTIGTGSSPGVKQPGRGVDHPPLSSAEVKERVELYLYSPCGPSWPVIRYTLPYIEENKCIFIDCHWCVCTRACVCVCVKLDVCIRGTNNDTMSDDSFDITVICCYFCIQM